MWRLTGTFSFIGIEFGVAALLGFFAGAWLDKQFDTAPFLTLLLMFLGFAAATRDLFRLVKKHRAQLAAEDRKRGGADDEPG
jgi:F0F1-type ATP synthase assembly protein I